MRKKGEDDEDRGRERELKETGSKGLGQLARAAWTSALNRRATKAVRVSPLH